MIKFFMGLCSVKWYLFVLTIILSFFFIGIICNTMQTSDIRIILTAVLIFPFLAIIISIITLIIKIVISINKIIKDKSSTRIQRLGVILFIPSVFLIICLFFYILCFEEYHRGDLLYFRNNNVRCFWYSSISLLISILMLNKSVDKIIKWIKNGQ